MAVWALRQLLPGLKPERAAKSLVVADQNEAVPPGHEDASARTQHVLAAYYDELDIRVRAVEREIDAIERCIDGLGSAAHERTHGITAQLSGGAHRAMGQAVGIVTRMTAQVRNFVTRP